MDSEYRFNVGFVWMHMPVGRSLRDELCCFRRRFLLATAPLFSMLSPR
jgi:hypothetical protein